MRSVVPALPDRATLRRAVASAVRAPSVYNSQPWRWQTSTTDGVDLFADPHRHLTIDPDGRDLLLSCGAALHHLIVALAELGYSARVDRFPDPENTHHLARVRPSTTCPSADTAELARAIALRRTDRRRFSARRVDDALLESLIGHAAACGVELHVVTGNYRVRLIEIISQSASLQRQQAGYGAELARWTHRYAGAGDGIDSGTVVSGVAHPGEVPMRAFTTRGRLAQSPHSFEHADSSVLMLLCSARDDRLGALRAGEAASAVLLAATTLGLATTPLSQPLEVAQTRAWIRDHILSLGLFPQLALRIGWAQPGCADLPPTPRRSLKDVLRER